MASVILSIVVFLKEVLGWLSRDNIYWWHHSGKIITHCPMDYNHFSVGLGQWV